MTGRLQGQIAVVTGAASGIGRAIAARFADEGATVVGADLNADDGLEASPGLTMRRCDVTDPDAVERLAAWCVHEHGRVDVLSNTAGILSGRARLHECDLESWSRVIHVNLTGTFLMMRSVLPVMMERGHGSIVNTASNAGLRGMSYAGLRGMPGSPPYGPSKAAVISLTKQAALEYAVDGIRINAICPGPTRTPLIENNPEGDDLLTAHIPLGRLGEVGDAASLALFLAADDSSWITGQAIAVDGGQTA